LLLWPRADGELSEVLRWVTGTHALRLHSKRGTAGTGSIYQGRYRSFPVQADAHVLPVVRLIESHARRAKLVKRSEDWRWSSLWQRTTKEETDGPALSAWPVPVPRQWLRTVNAAIPQAELDALRLCVQRGQPFGSEHWVPRTVKRLGLESTVRPRGRPRKNPS
jgi:putative transposase